VSRLARLALGGGWGSSPGWARVFSITCRSRMEAMILSSPAPQLGQCFVSMSNARLSSRNQLILPGRGGLDLAGGGCGFDAPFGLSRLLRQHQRPQLGVRGQNAVKAHEVQLRPRNQCRQTLHELQQAHYQVNPFRGRT
jgi:hypothetical protein